MGGALEGLKQIAEVGHPRSVRRLIQAGALDLRAPLSITAAFPWLIGRGPSLGILSHMHAVGLRSKPALVDAAGSLTWSELDGAANAFARALQKVGIGPGDKVALLLRNGREMVQAIIATQKIGAIACPLNTWAKTKELKAVVGNIDPALIVYDTAHTEQLKAAVSQEVPSVFVGDPDEAAGSSTPLDDFVSGCGSGPLSPFTRHRGSPKVVIQTSGTTGTPKGASRDASTTGFGVLADLLGSVPYRRADTVLCPAPLFHSFGLVTFSLATALGCTLVLPRSFDAEETLKLIEEHRATALSLVPVMIRRIVSLDDAIKNKYDLSSLRILLASGSALSLDLKKAALDLFGEVLYDLYGSTEVGWVAIATPEDIRTHPRSVGKPSAGIDIAILDQDGTPVAEGKTGELYVKSKMVFEGYTSGDTKAVREGFMSIGDLCRVDEDGYLYIESRSDDMVVIGGENVYPIEIEDLIESVPGVDEVTVLGIDDEQYGQVLAAFVVGDVSPADVRTICDRELAPYKVPKRIEVLDRLPRTSTGKVLKRELAARL
jgi:fatty-acyl-CoA synthase